jgi:hypothetical protein
VSSRSDCERKHLSSFQGVRELLFRRVGRVEFTTIFLFWFWVGMAVEVLLPSSVHEALGRIYSRSDCLMVLDLLIFPSPYWPFLLATPFVTIRAAVLALRRRALRWWAELVFLIAALVYISTWEFC